MLPHRPRPYCLRRFYFVTSQSAQVNDDDSSRGRYQDREQRRTGQVAVLTHAKRNLWNLELPVRLDENQRIPVLAGLSWSLLERMHKPRQHTQKPYFGALKLQRENPIDLRVVRIKVKMHVELLY